MIGSKIKELRKKKNLSQVELAKLLNITAGAVGLWEVEKRTPDLENLKKLAILFDVPLGYFYEEDNENQIIIIGRNGIYKKFNMSDKAIEAIQKVVESITESKFD